MNDFDTVPNPLADKEVQSSYGYLWGYRPNPTLEEKFGGGLTISQS